jgi:hypothetical protein
MLNVSTFRYTTDICTLIHFIPHACQHITVDQSHSSGDTFAKILEIIGEWSLNKFGIRYVVYLLRIF